MEVFNFQRPGPGGTTSGTTTDNKTAQWSKKGQGTISQDETEGTQTYTGHKKDQYAMPEHLVQVKPETFGCNYLQLSMTQQESKRLEREAELS